MTFLTLLFSLFIRKNILIFATYKQEHNISKVNYQVTTYVKGLTNDYVVVDYNIQLSPFPSGNPVVFLEYTINFPDYVVFKHINFDNSNFAKKVIFNIKKYNRLKTFVVKPKYKKIVLDSKINIKITTFVPFQKKSDGVYIAFIPSFKKINNLIRREPSLLFQPYVSNNYSILIKFTNNFILFKNINNELVMSIQNEIFNLMLVIYKYIGFGLLKIFFTLIILYNILWIIIRMSKLQK